MAWVDEPGAPAKEGKRFLNARTIVYVASVVAAAVGLAVLYLFLRTETSHSETFPAPGGRVEIELDGGSLLLRPSVENVVEVRRETRYFFRAPDIDQRIDGDRVVVEHKCPRIAIGPCSSDYVVEVPPSVDVMVVSGAARVDAEEMRGDLEVDGSSGDVRLAGVYGRLNVSSESGNVDAQDVHSLDASVDVKSGDVRLVFAVPPSTVDATSTSGDLTVEVPDSEAYRVDATTVEGRTLIDVRNEPSASRSVRLRSDSGSVTVTTA